MNTDLLQGFYLGDHHVDPREGRIAGPQGTVHLAPRPMEVLLCLASDPGEIQARSDLLDAVWGPGNGSQEALSHAVSEIRHALGDHADHPVYVQTVPRRGYRLLLPVRHAADDKDPGTHLKRSQQFTAQTGMFANLRRRGVLETALAYLVIGWLIIQVTDIVFGQLLFPAWAGTFVTALVIAGFPIAILLSWFLEWRDGRLVPHQEHNAGSNGGRFNRTYMNVIGSLGIAALLVFVYDRNIGLPTEVTDSIAGGELENTLPPVRANSIAVLPFLNVDGTERTDIFSNGLADDLITRLSRVPGLLVSSRGDSFTLAPNSGSSDVRERLRVAMYVEGSVHIEDDAIRVVVQLIDSDTGFHVVARKIDRNIDSFFEMRDELTEFIVANVRVALPPEIQEIPIPDAKASNLNAYVAYRRGKELYEQPHSLDLLDDVLGLYETALALDGEYAAAWSGICEAYVSRFYLSNAPDDIGKAESACTSALDANSRLHMVNTALGRLYRRTGRHAEASESFSTALEINPQDAPAMIGLARIHEREQRHDEAENLLRKAIEVQPGSWRNINSLGGFLFRTGRFGEAAETYRQVVALDRDNFQAFSNLGAALMMIGDFEHGKTAFAESLRIRESDNAYSNLGSTYYYLGEFDQAVAANRAAVDLLPQQPINWLNLADALYHAGETGEAEQAFRRGLELCEDLLGVDPNELEAMQLYSWAQQMLGNTDGARQAINRALEMAPNDPYSYYYLALIRVQSGQLDTAVEALAEAVGNGYPVSLLEAEPYLSRVRDRPDFRALVGSVN